MKWRLVNVECAVSGGRELPSRVATSGLMELRRWTILFAFGARSGRGFCAKWRRPLSGRSGLVRWREALGLVKPPLIRFRQLFRRQRGHLLLCNLDEVVEMERCFSNHCSV